MEPYGPLMRRLFLIRHGEPVSAWGGDATDPGLSAEGRVQASAAASELMARGRLAIISSPMLRCVETAQPYRLLSGIEPRIEKRVSEVVAPPGVTDRRAWLRETFPWAEGSEPRTWDSVDPALLRWREDVLSALRELRDDTAVFSHFIAINAIVTAATGSPHTIACKPGFASITEIALHDDGALQLIALGEEMRVDDVR